MDGLGSVSMPEAYASLTINLTNIVCMFCMNRNQSSYFSDKHGLKMGLSFSFSNHTFMVTDIFAHLRTIIYSSEDDND